MTERVFVFDFDGTFTDVEQEGVPFTAGYLEDLVALSGMPAEEIQRIARECEMEVAAQPEVHGWLHDGMIVAPASAAPYLRIKPIAKCVLDHAGAFRDAAERQRLLELLFRYNYRKTHTVFRPDARCVLEALAGTHAYVVTNANPETVRSELRTLDDTRDGALSIAWLLDRVHGGARKYIVDGTFDAVPETMALPGLTRAVHLRRGQYFNVLDGLRRRHEVAWSDVRVVGDIFELDGALPLALGAWFGLIANDRTPPYEVEFLSRHPRGRVFRNLVEVIPFLRE